MSSTVAETFCVNHPQTVTYLRCNRCGRPVCIKCVERTPVGYRCKDCLGVQRVGYYNANALDYALASLVAFVLGAMGGVIANIFGGWWILAIFAGPAAGGLVAEAIRLALRKRRGRYLNWIACSATAFGALFGAGIALIFFMFSKQGVFNPILILALPLTSLVSLFNPGFLIFIGLIVFTLYYRLRV